MTRCATCGAVAGECYPYTGVEVRMLAVYLCVPGRDGEQRYCTWECWYREIPDRLQTTA